MYCGRLDRKISERVFLSIDQRATLADVFDARFLGTLCNRGTREVRAHCAQSLFILGMRNSHAQREPPVRGTSFFDGRHDGALQSVLSNDYYLIHCSSVLSFNLVVVLYSKFDSLSTIRDDWNLTFKYFGRRCQSFDGDSSLKKKVRMDFWKATI